MQSHFEKNDLCLLIISKGKNQHEKNEHEKVNCEKSFTFIFKSELCVKKNKTSTFVLQIRKVNVGLKE